MALKKSPRGLIKPYTRVGITSSLKRTAKNSALMKSAVKMLDQATKVKATTEQQAEDVVGDIELLAMQMRAAAKSSIKELEKVLRTVGKYLAEASE